MDKALVNEWMKVAAELSILKAKEAELRKQICGEFIPEYQEGTHHYIMDELDLVGVGKVNFTVDGKLLESNWEVLPPEVKACFKFKPEVIKKTYKNMPHDSIVHKFITAKPGMPSLDIKPVKQ